MKYFKATYSNGYCGCYEDVYIKAETEVEAEEIAWDDIECYTFYEPDERFIDPYDYDDDEQYELAVEGYKEDITVEITEITREEYKENVKE